MHYPPGFDYEVFLSFRGTDTRKSFTDFLYADLFDAGIRTFLDDDELRVGEQIGPELLKAIKHSKIAIPIFSKGYADSKWCLLELTEMVECKRNLGQKILPIFYDVAPSDLKDETGCYEKAFRQHMKKFDEKKVKEWKEAMREVAKLKGWESKNIANGHQGRLIKMVVSEVWGELKKNSLVVTDYLVGIDFHVEEIMKLLNVDCNDVRVVGIHGMGGIGKTTIAKFIYSQLSERFECCSFLADVREASQKHEGLVNLQNKLLSNVLNHKSLRITTVDKGINVIKERLRNKKVLLVLDDVDQMFQFEAMAGNRDWFGSGSRIIITTRNKDVLRERVVDWTYELRELDSNQSLQLFSKHAFRTDYPPVDYEILSRDLVSTTGGLPLDLEIIGSFVSGKCREVWEGTLKKLEKIPNAEVVEKLRISYDALEYEQKQIFLDIACLFIGVDKRIAFHMWNDCEFCPENGIEILVLLSLVKIGDDNELRMHDKLRDLGRRIVRLENNDDPGERSRLWSHKEALDILYSRTGTKKVQALCLDFGFGSQEFCFTNEEFANLSNIRFLQVDYTILAGDFNRLFPKLRWLRWNACPQNFKPTNFRLVNLVILDLSWSKITEDWKGWIQIKMEKLKVLNLTGCDCLTKTPNFSPCATLERLILEGCQNLVQIDPSIGQLKGLVFLNIKNCSKLSNVPLEFGSLGALIELHIDGTSIKQVPFPGVHMKKLETLSATRCGPLTDISSSIGQLKSLSDLALDFLSITELPDSIGLLVKLQRLSLKFCSSLKTLPDSIGKLESLVELRLFAAKITELPDTIGSLRNLKVFDIAHSCITKLPNAIVMLEKLEEINASRCDNLEGEIPSNIGKLSSLRILKLDHTNIWSLPTSICGLSCLQTLDLSGCRELHLLPELELPSNLTNLHIEMTVPILSNLMNLKELWFSNCFEVMEIPRDIGKLSKLQALTLYRVNIITLPMEIGALSRLKKFSVGWCEKLKCLPDLPSSLFKLWLLVCESLERLPDLSNLKNLSELKLRRCLELTEIQGLGKLELLTSLDVQECKKLLKLDGLEQLGFIRYLNTSRCKSLEALPDLSNLKKLRSLNTFHCKKLIGIQGLDNLESLEYLDMSECISMERLPDLSNLEMLKDLELLKCRKLYEIEGLEVLTSLKSLCLSSCKSLERLPDLSNLQNLKKLEIVNCGKLTEIQGLQELKSLEILNMWLCISMERLPDLSNLEMLKDLELDECGKLYEIEGLEVLTSLKRLNLSSCTSLERLPDLSNLQNLKELRIRNGGKLTEIPGLRELKSLEFLDIVGCKLENLPDLKKVKR